MGERRGERGETPSLLQRRIEYREGAPLAEILADLRARGCSWGVIAQRLGIGRKTLWEWRQKSEPVGFQAGL